LAGSLEVRRVVLDIVADLSASLRPNEEASDILEGLNGSLRLTEEALVSGYDPTLNEVVLVVDLGWSKSLHREVLVFGEVLGM
jgi:hypothetical protein